MIRRSARSRSLVAIGAGFAFGAHSLTGGGGAKQASRRSPRPQGRRPRSRPARAPREMRGVHVTMALASVRGKLDEYLALNAPA